MLHLWKFVKTYPTGQHPGCPVGGRATPRLLCMDVAACHCPSNCICSLQVYSDTFVLRQSGHISTDSINCIVGSVRCLRIERTACLDAYCAFFYPQSAKIRQTLLFGREGCLRRCMVHAVRNFAPHIAVCALGFICMQCAKMIFAAVLSQIDCMQAC